MKERASNNGHEVEGLSSREAQVRLEKFGENSVYRKRHLRPLVAFVKKFNSPLTLLLIGSAAAALALGQTVSGCVILTMAFLSTGLDFYNSYKSQKIEQHLASRITTTVTVIRDGAKKAIALKTVVPGDMITLAAGNVIPADGKLIEADGLFVNQSSLTGESYPMEKFSPAPAHPGAAGPDAANTPQALTPENPSAVFMGTSVVAGYGIMEVVTTGSATMFGTVAERLASTEPETVFERGIRQFSYFIMRLTAVMAIFVFATNTFQGRPVLESFLFAVAIAVGLTPELLPVIMTVSLARGSLTMAKKNVVVKNLSSIENFGGMDVLCTDKTGTLTEDRITLVKCVDAHGNESTDTIRYAYLSSHFHTAKRSPLDDAIEAHGKEHIGQWREVDEIPFDFSRRRDSIVAEEHDRRMIITKGAPENILPVCTSVHALRGHAALTPQFKKEAEAQYATLSAQGFRVLAVAVKNVPSGALTQYGVSEETNMSFVGFAAFYDPPKATAREAIKELEHLGIDVKIITGDSEILTRRICEDLSLPVKGLLTGVELAAIDDAELQRRAPDTTVFARVTPDQKERIIQMLRASGRAVGYLGDGINDAPALKAADVGISVENAVDVARETADIILLKKNLHVLKDGVAEGRRTFLNTLKYVKMGFSSNFGNMFSMMAAPLFLPFLPMQPGQILVNNFIYDLSQTTLPGDRVDDRELLRGARWDIKYLRRYMMVFGTVSSVFDLLTFWLLFSAMGLAEAQFQTGWFIESIATQALVVHVIRNRRSFLSSRPSVTLIVSTLSAVIVAWVLPFTPLGALMGFAPLPPFVLAVIAGVVLCYLFTVELVKARFERFEAAHHR